MYIGSIGLFCTFSTLFRFRLVHSPFHIFPISSRLHPWHLLQWHSPSTCSHSTLWTSQWFSKISYSWTLTLLHTMPCSLLLAVPLRSLSFTFSYLLTLAHRVPVPYQLHSAYKNPASGFIEMPGNCGPITSPFLLCAINWLTDNLTSLLSHSCLFDLHFPVFVLAFTVVFAIISCHCHCLSPSSPSLVTAIIPHHPHCFVLSMPQDTC